MKIWTDDEFIEVDPNDVGQLEAAMLFKAEHIRAKADPELFAAVADMLSRLLDTATKRVDVIRCRECVGRPFWEKGHNDVPVCLLSGLYVKSEDDFCPYSARKEGAENEL